MSNNDGLLCVSRVAACVKKCVLGELTVNASVADSKQISLHGISATLQLSPSHWTSPSSTRFIYLNFIFLLSYKTIRSPSVFEIPLYGAFYTPPFPVFLSRVSQCFQIFYFIFFFVLSRLLLLIFSDQIRRCCLTDLLFRFLMYLILVFADLIC